MVRRFFIMEIGLIVCFLLVLRINAQIDSFSAERMMKILRNGIDSAEHERRLEQHRLYQLENPPTPFERGRQFKVFEGDFLRPSPPNSSSSNSAVPVKRLLVLVNKTLYADSTAKEKIDRYIEDVGSAYGCTVILETLEGGKPSDVKAVIKEHYYNGGLDGAVQIGKLPEPWYESNNDPTTGRYDNFTCDLYYMDLDGDWGDADNNGKFDSHTAGTGTLGIEIFYGRIDCTTMGNYGKEVDLLSEYMDKLHNYYLGKVTLYKAALGYLDHDWRTSDNYLKEIYPGSSGNELIRWSEPNPPVNRNDYLTNRLQKNYTALHMWCHANFDAHYHHTGGSSTINDVYKSNPKPVAYFQDGCHVSDFVAGRGKAFLGGAYVFNKSPTALLCLSGSRSGQWLGLMAKEMFQALSKNTCVGQAFKIWFAPYQNKSEPRDKQNFIGWNYGYNIFGDPMITLVERSGVVEVAQECKRKPIIGDVYSLTNRKTMIIRLTSTTDLPFDIDLFTLSGKRLHPSFESSTNHFPHATILNYGSTANGAYIVSLKTASIRYAKRINIVE